MKLAETKKVLKDFTTTELTQMHIGLCMNGKVLRSSLAYSKALERNLIQPDGTPHNFCTLHDAVNQALSFWSTLWRDLRGKA